MRRAFLLSIRWHLGWFFKAFSRESRRMAPLRPRRLFFLLVLYPLFLLFQGIHWAGFLVDEILFRRYRKITVKEPLFVMGIPRSGTTFVHRTLAKDTETFTTFQTWQAILAPSITERQIIRFLSRLDKLIGQPLHSLIRVLTRKLTGSFSHIHEVGLKAPEEDYLALLPAGGCFILVLAFPASQSLWQLGRFHEMPDEQKDTLIHFYKSCLQKHLFFAAPGQRLLSKNAAFGSWLPDLRFAFPDARYVACVREPTDALSSQLSSLRSGLKFFGTMGAADLIAMQFQTAFAHLYRILLEEKKSFLVDHLAIIDQSHLRTDPQNKLGSSLRQLGLPLTDTMMAALEAAREESEQHQSQHEHAPLTSRAGPSEFGTLVRNIYEEILREPHISRDDKSN